MMLLGANSRDVVRDVGVKVAQIRKTLPPGVQLDVLYDRAEFVERTVRTVVTNLLEGIAIVTLVLALMLGTLRGALAVVLGIPASMAVALLGMRLFGVTGDLMSLGAIDFGFLVDGPIVLLEAVMAATAGRKLVAHARARAYADIAREVARPVAFAVAIIALVYVPLLSLEGIEGKMFRPMALTMACALAGALLYSVALFPAVLVTLVPPPRDHGPHWLEVLTRKYAQVLPMLVRWRWQCLAVAALALVLTGVRFAAAGAEFVPRIFEGDAVVTIRRAPSISLTEARRMDLAAEKVLHRFPEVITSLAMTGRAEVAVDPVGNDNTDILVALRPVKEWTTAHDFDDLCVAMKDAVEKEVPGTFVSVSQPIEDRTNEMISGSRADVAIQLFGTDVERLGQLADHIGQRIKRVPGAGDVRIERVTGQPTLTAQADRARMARYGVQVEDAFSVLAAARAGIPVGSVYEDQKKFELRVLQPAVATTVEGLGNLFVETAGGRQVALREVVNLSEGEGPTQVRHSGRERTVRIDVNLRGRDLVSFVEEARHVVAREFPLPSGYRVQWGGQFENFARAQARLAMVVPIVVALIFGMLVWMFGNLRYAAGVFALVPLSLTGGMVGLLLRGMSFSLPAAVGFIALGGIAVLNGVVMASEVRRRIEQGESLESAVVQGPAHVLRAVLTTAAVAALGFLPMALTSSAGAEVQRPLATAVVVGMAFATALTLVVLPGVLRIVLKVARPSLATEPFDLTDPSESRRASSAS
jgi:cobalt-zinc-cadmium resistance protein CzcA